MLTFLCRLLVVISYILLPSMFRWVIDRIKYLPITMGIKRNDRTPNTLNSTPEWKYDVFLSFAGKDTRLKFTDHLYDALRSGGINAFRDDEGIERGEVISQQLIQAIKDSSCAVVVLSENYADSTWCLDELQSILEGKRELDRQVFPIFYDIDPSDVRHQRQNFGEALAKHEKKFGLNKVQNWRNALSEISHLSGWDTRDRHEAELIKDIVEKVWTYLSSKLPSYDDELVGIESRVCDMMTILEVGLDDKFFVGIWGMGGLGKTTLARVVCEKISDKFEVCCFLANVRETLLQREGLVSLQKKLLSHLKVNDMEIFDDFDGMKKIRKLLCNKKVFLVLDDLNDMSQLENLAKSPDWFGKGSRILITTRDSHLLTTSGVQRMYDMKTMKKDESLRLFSKEAFKEDYPKQDYLELSKDVVEYAGGLPLALKVLGSYFHGRSKAEWIDALSRLKKQVNPSKRIFEVLKISYDGLDVNEQTIFLDIVCFFKHWQKKEVTQILESCDLHPTIGIKVLIEKALLVETRHGKLKMHDLIEEMGRDIVHQESPDDVFKRSRLWKLEDIKELLENNKGSEAIQAIVMQDNYEFEGRIELHPEAFSKMSGIRLLLLKDMIDGRLLILPRGFKLPDTLKVVQWPLFPCEALPLETPLNELVHVKMNDSGIKQLWNVIQPMKMKFIDLSYCHHFIETPDFSGAPCLEHLRLYCCTSLVKVHPSLGELKKLVEVELHKCKNLEILPRKLKTNSLVKLYLAWCTKVVVLPEFAKGMAKLSYLDVSHIAITRIPKSFGSLTGLRDLNLSCCGLNDGWIPDNFGCLSSLIALDLGYNDFVNLPTTCFSGLFRLLFLSLDGCGKLKSLPRLPPQLLRLNAPLCRSMEPLSSDRQLWNFLASLDHEYRGQTEYVISVEESDEEYDDTISIFKHTEREQLPLRDFFANVPGCKIPSWFPNTYVPSRNPKSEHVIEVEIPPYLRYSEWSGIVVCLHISDYFDGLISWSSKALEDDDYIRKEWAHRSTTWNAYGYGRNMGLYIMVLELNKKTCWQHLKARDSSLHIIISAQTCGLECGWRLICKEEIQKWRNDNDFNQHTQSQLASPHDEINLPSRVFDQFIAHADKKQFS